MDPEKKSPNSAPGKGSQGARGRNPASCARRHGSCEGFEARVAMLGRQPLSNQDLELLARSWISRELADEAGLFRITHH
jgi:hypothetical protein